MTEREVLFVIMLMLIEAVVFAWIARIEYLRGYSDCQAANKRQALNHIEQQIEAYPELFKTDEGDHYDC